MNNGMEKAREDERTAKAAPPGGDAALLWGLGEQPVPAGNGAVG